MSGIFTVVILLSTNFAAAKTSTEFMHAERQQAHDDAKLLRMKLPSDVSDEKVLDLTTKLITRGVPLEVLRWYLDHEQANGKTGQVLVDDIEALATTMGGSQRMHGILRPSTSSLIQMIEREESVTDNSQDAAFMWSDEEYAEDLKLMQKPESKAEMDKPSGTAQKDEAETKGDIAMEEADARVKQLQAAAKRSDAAAPGTSEESSKSTDTTENKAEKKNKDITSFGFWDVIFFVLLGLVIFVAGWWAYKLRLHDRVLVAFSDMVFRFKKCLAGMLKGREYDTVSDDVSDTSLQTGTEEGSAVTGTTSSSGMDGVNNQLQGVIDRVRSSFQNKDANPEPAAAADVERPASSEEAPKKGYTRQSKK